MLVPTIPIPTAPKAREFFIDFFEFFSKTSRLSLSISKLKWLQRGSNLWKFPAVTVSSPSEPRNSLESHFSLLPHAVASPCLTKYFWAYFCSCVFLWLVRGISRAFPDSCQTKLHCNSKFRVKFASVSGKKSRNIFELSFVNGKKFTSLDGWAWRLRCIVKVNQLARCYNLRK